MKKVFVILYFILFFSLTSGIEKADSVLIIKSESKLFLMKNGKVIGKYHTSFGANPKGHKQQEGDERTPEGKYFIDYKKEDSAFYKSIHISYPNDQDRKKAKEKGLTLAEQ
jgi:murein L,D-transpeptidase YafK